MWMQSKLSTRVAGRPSSTVRRRGLQKSIISLARWLGCACPARVGTRCPFVGAVSGPDELRAVIRRYPRSALVVAWST